MNLYYYKARVVSIYDGDTIRLDIDLGFNTWLMNQSVRLYGIDTPELRGVERIQGISVRDDLIARIPPGTEVLMESIMDKTGKYGRWLANIWLEGENLNEWLISTGRAKKYPV